MGQRKEQLKEQPQVEQLGQLEQLEQPMQLVDGQCKLRLGQKSWRKQY